MNQTDKREVWQRGPIENIPALLQPVAHALLQAREEVNNLVTDFPIAKIWEKPVGVASVGFHLQHLTGVLDRLFTYARREQLSMEQMDALSKEGKPTEVTIQQLVDLFNNQVDKALLQLSQTDEQMLTETRGVGRAQLPTTVIGLLFHSAEHTMRHIGQLHVTVTVIKESTTL